MHRKPRNITIVTSKITFKKMLDSTRVAAAEGAWKRALNASTLRHAIRRTGKGQGVIILGEIKRDAARLARKLAPDRVRVRIDCDYQIGLLSVEWRGHGRIHLPAATNTEDWAGNPDDSDKPSHVVA